MSGKKDLSGYQFAAMSNLVLQADRRQLPRRTDEPTGAPESLVGRIDPKEMGSRATRTKADTASRKKAAQASKDPIVPSSRRKTGHGGPRDVLAATDDIENLRYRPRTAETRETYDLILAQVYELLDAPPDTIRSAADLMLEHLKDDALKDFDKKKAVEKIFDQTMTNTLFSDLLNLSKKITDYADDDEQVKNDVDEDQKDGRIDDETGVAVVFDEEEEEDEMDEDEEDGGGFEVDDDDDAASDAEGGDAEAMPIDDLEAGDEEVNIGGQDQSKDHGTGLSARDIDAFWLQRLVGQSYADQQEQVEKTTAAMDILASESNIRDCENQLMELFDYDKFELVGVLVQNRDLIVWCTRLARSDAEERVNVEVAMREKGIGWILKELSGIAGAKPAAVRPGDEMQVDAAKPTTKGLTLQPSLVQPQRTIDIEGMVFEQGARLMSNKKTTLPEGSFKRQKKGYEEVHVPAPAKGDVKAGENVSIDKLPEWARLAFPGTTNLNRVQSRLFPVAFGKDEPILLCAPTGAGKTNVAMLTILHELGKHRDEVTGAFDLDAFKIVYVAPMKALVQEMVGNFGKRLEPYGVKVSELTGDRNLTKQQIAETQMIITTPEKWDVITRKSTDTSYTNLVRLIIIDEIHLLHDERGPVLEAIVSRTLRRAEQTHDDVRLIGLSATLPNFRDVARFLRVNPASEGGGLFEFGPTYRPCPLRQQFVGVTEKRAIMRHQVMNEVCYEKVLDHAGSNQVLVFVHSRKETAKTAKALRDMAIEKETITSFIRPDSASREILLTEADKTASDANLKDLLPFGFAIHHAGMNRVDRGLVEDLFADGHIQVLVCTATLAWGVNLPAHAVIIKGTQIYNPEKGRWQELSPQDVLQMIGRAGRPQYDTFGESVIITNHSELQYYLSMLNQQLPIESQLAKKLADNLNAEIVLGTIRSRDEAVEWLSYTYYYCRILKNPALYGVSQEYREDDPKLLQFRADLIHAAAVTLEKAGMLKYTRSTGKFVTTEIGRIASHYYVTARSMGVYNTQLRPTASLIELLRTFSLSDEFKFIPVREEEKGELSRLLDRVPIPVKEKVEEGAAKINVLLQAYISQLKLDGFALVSDMVYVTSSAGRILRAMFEICLRRGWASATYKALELCKMVEKRMWPSMSPLRQFKGVPVDIVRRAERKEFPWYRYFDLDPPELGELIGMQNAGRLVHRLVHQFPKLELQAAILPITRSMIRIELTITPDFKWEEKVHGSAETFWIVVEDVDGEVVLFFDQFILRQRYAEEDHYVTFTVPMMDPQPPNYFITVVSDRWMHSETRLPLSFKNLILPEKFPPPTTLLDLQPLPVSALNDPQFEKIFSALGSFNKIQTQVFQALYTTNENVVLCAPTGSGKTICAEFALMRLWKQGTSRCVCIVPYQDVVDLRVAEWSAKFGRVRDGKKIVALTGETSADLRLLNSSDVVVCTPEQWDVLSRRWKQRKAVGEVGLIIADEVHMIGADIGPTYEVALSRARFVIAQLESHTRIVAFGTSLATARDLGGWLGASAQNIFNFAPGDRPLPLNVHLQAFNVSHFPSLMIQMARPCYLAIAEYSPQKPVIVFVPSRKQCRLTADDLLTYCLGDEDPDRFLNIERSDLAPHLERIDDLDLRETLAQGIGFYHEGLSKQDKLIVERLFAASAIQIVVASKDTAWSIPLTAYMVVIFGTQTFEGKEHRYVDYPFTTVLQMMGRACRPTEDESSRCVLMVPQVRKEFYLKFITSGLPIESHLHLALAEHFNAETTSGVITNKQDAVDWLTWTLLYRRLAASPNYYNLTGSSHRHLSDHLSELVESTLSDLAEAKMIEIEDEMDLKAMNMGMIAAYYDIKFLTCDTFNLSLTEKTKLKGLLEIVSSADEYQHIPIRHREDITLKRIYDRVPVKLADPNFNEPRFKVNVLLQAHFSRLTLPADLASDQAEILGKVLRLLSACVDVMSSSGYLNALSAMDLSQMTVQAVWNNDSPLRQVPHFSAPVITRCKEAGVESVHDLIDLEDDQRNALLKFDGRQMRDVARFCNAYPSLDVSHEVADPESLNADDRIVVKVTLDRGDDEDEDETPSEYTVVAPFYPMPKQESWWVVIGEQSTRTLLSIKKVPLLKRHVVSLDFNLKEGKHDLTLSVVSDSYIGCDLEFAFSVQVAEGEQDSEDDDDDDDGMEE